MVSSTDVIPVRCNMQEIIFAIQVFPVQTAVVVGLLVGSFLNVLICRIPAMEWAVSNLYKEHRENLIRPSACPRCARKIRPWENIPLLSYVLLRGQCKGCKAGISLLYPTIELVTAVASGLLVWWSGHSFRVIVSLCLLWTLIPILYILITKARVSALLSLWVAVFILVGAVIDLTMDSASEWTTIAGAFEALVACSLLGVALKAGRASKRMVGPMHEQAVPRAHMLLLLALGTVLHSWLVMAIILVLGCASLVVIVLFQALQSRAWRRTHPEGQKDQD